jgi:long-chain fatty acid transport protein
MKKYILFSVLITASVTANAAGFALIEQSGSGMGNAFAGAAAVAEDASTIFFNPAGMTYIEGTQAVGVIHLIKPSADFNDNGSTKGFSVPSTLVSTGGDGGDPGDLAFVPNFFYKRDLSDTVKFGLGVSAPFGLKTDYDKDWIGRFQAIKSEVKTININPSFAFKVNDQLSLGMGISAMWAQAELTRAVNRVVAPESSVNIKGDDWGFGYNLGAIYQATESTRIGVAYRSKIDQHLDGKAKFAGALAVNNANAKADITLPETLSVSAFSQINDKWDLLGDVTWTRWSRFRELRVDFSNALPDAVTTENWNNTMRYSVGVNYHYSDKLKLRTGLAYDEEAIDDEFRTARIPSNDRKWLSFGAGWQATPMTKLDVGYAHLFIRDAKIDDDQTSPAEGRNGRIVGKYDGSVDILSVQVSHNF